MAETHAKKRNVIIFLLMIIIFCALSISVFVATLISALRKTERTASASTQNTTTLAAQAKNTTTPITTTVIPTTIIPAQKPSAFLNMPIYKQKYSLSCEAAATSSALKFLGINKTEDNVLAVQPYDKTPRKVDANGKITWGDPYKAYIGDYKGVLNKTGYGIYAPAIAEVVNKLGAKATVKDNMTMEDIYTAIDQGNPVLVWVPTKLEDDILQYWTTPDGKQIPWIAREHVMVFIGYDKNKNEIKVMDVGPGVYRTVSEEQFTKVWAYLGNQAVIVSKM